MITVLSSVVTAPNVTPHDVPPPPASELKLALARTLVGTVREALAPSPICPAAPAPQQNATASGPMAQLCCRPSATLDNITNVATVTGMLLDVVLALPS